MAGVLSVLIGAVAMIPFADQILPPHLSAGSTIEVCGRVTGVVSEPRHCSASLEVNAGDGSAATRVWIPAAVRRGTPGGRELEGAEACFTGVVEVADGTTKIRVPSFDSIRVTTAAASPSFGAGVADACLVDGVQNPRVLYDVKPRYSPEAVRERVQGAVVMDAVVDTGGAVSELRVTRSLHPDLDQNALNALREWRFAPGTVNGVPAPVLVQIEMTFSLNPHR